MSGLYRISATPLLHSRGDFKGKLKGVSFMAASPTDTKEWFSNNCGQFELAFSRIMTRALAGLIVDALKHGDDVEFPGLYSEQDFDSGFLFEWPAVHLTLPAIYFQESASA